MQVRHSVSHMELQHTPTLPVLFGPVLKRETNIFSLHSTQTGSLFTWLCACVRVCGLFWEVAASAWMLLGVECVQTNLLPLLFACSHCIQQILEAVLHCHQMGVVHRDLKVSEMQACVCLCLSVCVCVGLGLCVCWKGFIVVFVCVWLLH